MFTSPFSRRNALKSGLVTAGAMVAGQILAGEAAFAAPGDKIADTTAKCIKIGQACETHCIAELGKGNKDMAACLTGVRDMLAACTALQTLASANSKHLKAMAKVCGEICVDCAKSCEPHTAHMQICKDCHDACLECEKACKEV